MDNKTKSQRMLQLFQHLGDLKEPLHLSLVVVRHGESFLNREHTVQGHIDSFLSPTGVEQAALAGDRFAARRFHAAYSSDLSRAHMTADGILSRNDHFLALGGTTADGMDKALVVNGETGDAKAYTTKALHEQCVLEDKASLAAGTAAVDGVRSLQRFTDLRERYFGDLEGKSYLQFRDFIHASKVSNDHEYDPPNGESAVEFRARIASSFWRLLRDVGLVALKRRKAAAATSNGPAAAVRTPNAGGDKSAEKLSSSADGDDTTTALIVTHGGFIRTLLLYFLSDMGLSLPGGRKQAVGVPPNTGVCEFRVTIDPLKKKVDVECVRLHSAEHLEPMKKAMEAGNGLEGIGV